MKREFRTLQILRQVMASISFFAALGASFLLTNQANATMVTQLSLNQMIDQADLIVEGDVSSIRSDWDETNNTIFTYVTLTDLRVVHGDVPNGELTLRFEGGKDGGREIVVHGSPTFENGEHAFLFVRDNGIAVSPVVGLFQGRFKVNDSGTLMDHAGAPIVSIEDGTIVKVEGEASTQAQGRWQRMQQQVAAPNPGTPDDDTVGLLGTADESDTELLSSDTQLDVAGQLAPTSDEISKEFATDSPDLGPPTAVQASSNQVTVLQPSTPAVIMMAKQDDTGERLDVDALVKIIQDRIN